VSCQQYGIHKRSGEPRAHDILRLMIDEVEEPVKNKPTKGNQKVYYYSVLVKVPKFTDHSSLAQNMDQDHELFLWMQSQSLKKYQTEKAVIF
ncbi:hypothetical protein CARUB_v10008005mg, partial [Capsella rubella]